MVRGFIRELFLAVAMMTTAAAHGQSTFTSAETLLSECGTSSWRYNDDCVFHFGVIFTGYEYAGGGNRYEGICFPRDFSLRKHHYIDEIRDAIIRYLKSTQSAATDLSTIEARALSKKVALRYWGRTRRTFSADTQAIVPID